MNGNNMIPIAPAASYPVSKSIDIQRKKRTRAKRSCDKCRIKKTRCDADLYQPCTKCRLSGYECSFLVEQKKRGPTSGNYVEVLENRLQRMEKLLQNIAAKDKQSDIESDANSSESPPADTTEPPSFRLQHGCPRMIDTSDLQEDLDKLTISDFERTRYIGASSGVHFLNTELFNSNKVHRIAENPKWLIQKLNQEEDEHVIIKSKKTDTPETPETKNYASINRAEYFKDIPNMNQEFIDYLIHMYFTRVHNYCPVLNKVHFLEQYYFHKPSPPDKYILYIIAYICVSVFAPNIISTQAFNYNEEQLKEIQENLKAKSHQLLNFVHKRSMVSTVQALMLLSMFMRPDADDEDTSHWFIAGMAIRMAQDLGMHRDCSKWPIPEYEIELRRRIWYAAYLMDRWVAADLGRPISIIDNDFEVELPTPYELNYEPTLMEPMMPILILETEEARQNNKTVYSSFVQLVTLSQIAGQVLVGLHSPRAKQARDNKIELVNILDRNLTHWKSQLPRELRMDTNDPQFYFSTTAAVINLAHGCVLLLLYRPFIKKYSEENSEDSNLAIKALGICTAIATEILTIVESMERDYFVALPWNMSVYCIFQAAIIFLHNAKGGNEYFKEHGKQNLIRCAKVYQHDPFLHNARAIKVLEHLVLNFDVFLGESSGSSTPEPQVKKDPKQQFGELFAPWKKQGRDLPDRIESRISNMEYELQKDAITSALVYDSNTYFASQQQPSPDNKSESSGATHIETTPEATMPDQFIKTINTFESTRPEDMFTSSLSMTLGRSAMNDQQHYSVVPRNTESRFQQVNDLSFDFNPSVIGQPQASVYFDQQNEVAHSIDLASLSSQIPLWDIPSGISWNDWESFMKSNAALVSSVNAQSCNPSNCKASCTPSCSSDEVCTLGTMVTCGVCPTSRCLPRSSLGNNSSSNTSSSPSNSGLIGGLVGGLIGGGLLLGGAIYICVRRRNKKNNLPLAFRHKFNKSNKSLTEMKERNINNSSREVVSGVIPVTFIPPSNSTHTSFYSEAETPRHQVNSFATFATNNEMENPFSDRPISTAESFLTTTTNTDYRRDSIESNISQQPARAVVQATQVLRAKPQIMRVNTVRVQDGVTRSGSFKKTIQPQESQTTVAENPFDDSNKIRQSVASISNIDTRSNKVTDSVVSTAADGEITIFFNGN